MPDETDKLKAEQEKNWALLRNNPANTELSRNPKTALGSLDTYGVSGKNPDEEDMKNGRRHTEASESF